MVAAGALISGAGTNLQAIVDRIAAGRLDCDLRVVISNRPGAAGLARAEAAGIPTRVIDHRGFATREDFDHAVVRALREAHVELVVLIEVPQSDFPQDLIEHKLHSSPDGANGAVP